MQARTRAKADSARPSPQAELAIAASQQRLRQQARIQNQKKAEAVRLQCLISHAHTEHLSMSIAPALHPAASAPRPDHLLLQSKRQL